MEFQINNFKTAAEQKEQLTKKLSSIPTTSGIYRIYFPCGKSYIGFAANLQLRIRSHLSTIYLTLRYEDNPELYSIDHKLPKWYIKAFRDLEGDYSLGDLIIRYEETDNKMAAKELIKEGKNLYNR